MPKSIQEFTQDAKKSIAAAIKDYKFGPLGFYFQLFMMLIFNYFAMQISHSFNQANIHAVKNKCDYSKGNFHKEFDLACKEDMDLLKITTITVNAAFLYISAHQKDNLRLPVCCGPPSPFELDDRTSCFYRYCIFSWSRFLDTQRLQSQFPHRAVAITMDSLVFFIASTINYLVANFGQEPNAHTKNDSPDCLKELFEEHQATKENAITLVKMSGIWCSVLFLVVVLVGSRRPASYQPVHDLNRVLIPQQPTGQPIGTHIENTN